MGDELGSRFLYGGDRQCFDGLWTGMIVFVCLLAIVPAAFFGYFFKYRREILKHDGLDQIIKDQENFAECPQVQESVAASPPVEKNVQPLPAQTHHISLDPTAHVSAATPRRGSAPHVIHHSNVLHHTTSVPIVSAARQHQPLRRVVSEQAKGIRGRASVVARRMSVAVANFANEVKKQWFDKLHSKFYLCACHQFTPCRAWWNGLGLTFRYLAVGASVVNPPPTASFLLMILSMGMLLCTATMRPYRSEFASKLDIICTAILVIQFAVSMFVQQPEMIGIPASILNNSPGAEELIESFSSARNAFSLIPILALGFYYGRQALPIVVIKIRSFRNRNDSIKNKSGDDDNHELDSLEGFTLDNEQGDFDRSKYDKEFRAQMLSYAPTTIDAAAPSTAESANYLQSSASVDVSKRPLISNHHVTKRNSASLPPRSFRASEDAAITEDSESS
jgi:hypothetical protein